MKRMNLIPAMQDLDGQIKALKDKYEHDLAVLTKARETVGRLNETCTFCEGRGWNLRHRSCAEDDRPDPDNPNDRIKCPACHGTGWKHWADEKGEEHSAEHYNQLSGMPRVSQ